MMDIKEDLLLWFTIFFCKSAFKNDQLAEELQKPFIRKFKETTFYSRFKDNVWGADLADMQLISKFKKGFRFLLCVIDIFSKYARVLHLKDKKRCKHY